MPNIAESEGICSEISSVVMNPSLNQFIEPSHLSRVLTHLNALPRLKLISNLKSLKLTLAFRNDHFGARYFVKQELPRIRWANPTLPIQVIKVHKTPQQAGRAEMELEFEDGKQHTFDMHEKWSTTILKELMEVAGDNSFSKWKSDAASAGGLFSLRAEKKYLVVKRPPGVPATDF